MGEANGLLQVLFIGNSYTYFYNMPTMVKVLSANEERPILAEMIASGGAALEYHWNSSETREKLSSRHWDFVMLQEQSLRPLEERELFDEYADRLALEVKTHGAKPVFYLTWARKATPERQGQLTQAYEMAVARTGALLAPVGEAWRVVRAAHPHIELFDEDGSHPSRKGAYLAACVIYATLYGQSPIGFPARFSLANGSLVDIPENEATILQTAAWEAMASYR